MARDYRVRPKSEHEKVAGLALENWRTLSGDQRLALVTGTPSFEEAAARSVMAWTLGLQRSFARSLEALRVRTESDADWTGIARLHEVTREAMFFEALLALEGNARSRLLAAASKYLSETPESEWLWTIGRRSAPVGLEELKTSARGWLDLWRRLEVGAAYPHGLQEPVGLALALMAEHDGANFFHCLNRVRNPLILKILCDRYLDDLELNLHLVCRDEALVAALGLHAFVSYLRALDRYADARVRELDPFSDQLLDVAPLVAERGAIRREIATRAPEVIAHLDGGAQHDDLLAELLAEALQLVSTGNSTTGQELLIPVVEAIAKRISGEPAAEVRILNVLRQSGRQAMAAAEIVAQQLLPSDEEVSKRWRHLLVAHLRERLTAPARDRLEGPISSDTDTLKPLGYHQEQAYISLASQAVGSLAQAGEIRLSSFFSETFADLKLLGKRRDRSFSQWLATAPRAAFLMLVGQAILSHFGSLPDLGELTELLGRELAARASEWEWYEHTGYSAASELENAAISALGQALPASAAISILRRIQSVCSALALAGKNGATIDMLERNLAADLLLIDESMLIYLLRQLSWRGLWKYYGQAFERYRQVVDKSRPASRSPAQLTEERLFEALNAVCFADRAVAIDHLVKLCEEVERYRLRDSQTLRVYVVALRFRVGYGGHDEVLERKIRNSLELLQLTDPCWCVTSEQA